MIFDSPFKYSLVESLIVNRSIFSFFSKSKFRKTHKKEIPKFDDMIFGHRFVILSLKV